MGVKRDPSLFRIMQRIFNFEVEPRCETGLFFMQ